MAAFIEISSVKYIREVLKAIMHFNWMLRDAVPENSQKAECFWTFLLLGTNLFTCAVPSWHHQWDSQSDFPYLVRIVNFKMSLLSAATRRRTPSTEVLAPPTSLYPPCRH